MKTLRDNRIAERSKRNAAITGMVPTASAAATLVSRRALCGRAVLFALSAVCGSGSVAGHRDSSEQSYQNGNKESWSTAWEEESD